MAQAGLLWSLQSQLSKSNLPVSGTGPPQTGDLRVLTQNVYVTVRRHLLGPNATISLAIRRSNLAHCELRQGTQRPSDPQLERCRRFQSLRRFDTAFQGKTAQPKVCSAAQTRASRGWTVRMRTLWKEQSHLKKVTRTNKTLPS